MNFNSTGTPERHWHSGGFAVCPAAKRFLIAAVRAAEALTPRGHLFLALNDAVPAEENADHRVEIIGQTMYARAYSEEDIRNHFSRAGMVLTDIARDWMSSPHYGEKRMLVSLLRKDGIG